LWAKITPAERQRVALVLPPAALPLFTQMPVDAQRHSLNVLESLWQAGHRHSDLAVAALLHDCGKVAAAQGGVALQLWLRGPLVLLNAFFPRLVARWATANPAKGWRYALYVHREHPAIGAAWAANAGCSPFSCWLITLHETPARAIESEFEGVAASLGVGGDEARKLLAALQAADNGN
jgi:hypothetical protein